MEAIYKEKSWYYCIHDPNSTEEQQIYRSEAKVVWIFPILLFPLLHLRNSALCIFHLKALLCINASFHRYQICLSVKLLTATILRMIRMYKLIVIYYLFHQEYIEWYSGEKWCETNVFIMKCLLFLIEIEIWCVPLNQNEFQKTLYTMEG